MKFLLLPKASFFILLVLCLNQVNSAETKYKVSDIPPKLLIDAKAVVRNSETVFEISGINKAVMKVTYAITILNANGINNSVLIRFYDKFLSVRKIRVDLYDQNGVAINNGFNLSVKDYSANSGYSIYEDNRVKLLDPKYRTTPFTVEYTYEIVYDGLLFYPDWTVYEDYNIAVEKSRFAIIAPNGFKIRYLEKLIVDKCKKSEGKDKTTYAWTAENMTAIKKEPYSLSIEEYTPVVYTAPSDFEMGSYKGNLESWNNFGKWINLLGQGRNILSPETNEKVKKMVSGIDNESDKIKVLYHYLQNKVRYVSIQKGIGGWQTINAETVDRLSYGDCKALSNYMKSLLDIAGIKSYYTLVYAGENVPVIKSEFPSNQFNHVIICVPINSDTIWLECTSQHIPFGYLGTFTDNRNVLLTNENGGFLVKTKNYSINDNKQIRRAFVDLNAEGNATASIKTEFKGTLYDKVCWVLQMDETDKRKDVQTRINIPSYNLVSFSHKEDRNILPCINENLKLDLSGYGAVIGNKILFNPNLMTKLDKLPYKTRERRSDIIIKRSFNEIDTITYKIPVSYKLDQIPEKIIIASRFGEYWSEISTDNNAITYIRKFSLFSGSYPVSDYSDFVDFFEKISTADEHKIALARIN